MPDLKMPQLNYIQVAGRLTRDPELTYAGGGNKPTCGFSLAVDDGYGDKKQTSFFNCRAWEKQAERVAALHKGDCVIVEGRMTEESYKTKDGEQRKAWKLTVRMVHELQWQERGDDQPRPQRSPVQRNEEPPSEDCPF